MFYVHFYFSMVKETCICHSMQLNFHSTINLSACFGLTKHWLDKAFVIIFLTFNPKCLCSTLTVRERRNLNPYLHKTNSQKTWEESGIGEPKCPFLPLLSRFEVFLCLPPPSVKLYSQGLSCLMPGTHRNNRTRRKFESQREGVTEKESSLFG